MTDSAFSGFRIERVATPRGDVHAQVGGAGPPLLLLHGYPETVFAPEITGRAVSGASHFLAEDEPDEVGADLAEFFGDVTDSPA